MEKEVSVIFSSALKLNSQDRQELAESLWDSLGMESELPSTTDSDFASETSQRRSEIVEGRVSTISHQELKKQLGR
jgi:putative addiction module component (TIGR02574 family)